MLAESPQVEAIVAAVTQYVARRLVERERTLAGDTSLLMSESRALVSAPSRRPWRGVALFIVGAIAGEAGLLAAAWFLDPLIY